MRRADEEKYQKAKKIFDRFENPTENQKYLFSLCQKAYDYLRKNDDGPDIVSGCDSP